ncbi:MAG: chorismate mutase [Azospirillaceae bacterium]
MSDDDPATLDKLRTAIDRVDDEMHELLMQRARIVEQIAGAKKGTGLPVRMDREMAIVRRLIERHQGAFPVLGLVRIWREIIAGSTAIQAEITIAVASELENGETPLRDLARDYYGSVARLLPGGTALASVRMVMDGRASLGVVPWPVSGGEPPWWTGLMTRDEQALRIIAGLPIASVGRESRPEAVVVARRPHSATGEEHSLVGLELAEDVSRSRLREVMETAGLVTLQFWSWGQDAGVPNTLVLVEVEGFVAEQDPRLAEIGERLGPSLLRCNALGAFNLPIRVKSLQESPHA